jgi:hypothetical protein
MHFNYSCFAWRASAPSGDNVNWDDFDDESDFQKLYFQFTGMDMKWLLFHKAAYGQRKTLEDKISKVRPSS